MQIRYLYSFYLIAGNASVHQLHMYMYETGHSLQSVVFNMCDVMTVLVIRCELKNPFLYFHRLVFIHKLYINMYMYMYIHKSKPTHCTCIYMFTVNVYMFISKRT